MGVFKPLHRDPAQPDDRRRGDGLEQRERGGEHAARAFLQARPENAEAIAHPPLAARVADSAFLVGLGAFRVIAGIIAFNVLPTDGMDMSPAPAVAAPAGTLVPQQTVLLTGGASLSPDPASLMITAGKPVALVVTNDTGDPRIARLAAGRHARGGHGWA